MENATVLWERTQRRAPKCLQIIPFPKKTMAEDMNESDGDVGPMPIPAGN